MSTWYVHKAVNTTKKEIYYGASKDATSRVDGSHCDGSAQALGHWDFAKDTIQWTTVSKHRDQPAASDKARYLEKLPVPGYTAIRTAAD